MNTIVHIAVGPGRVPLPDAARVAAAAEAAGVTAIRLAADALDPILVASYLAGLHGNLGYVAELPTTGAAPYTAARRLLSLDSASHGRAGVALQAGDSVRRWAEYARVLSRLFELFPRGASADDRPVIVADLGILDMSTVAATADVVVAGPQEVPGADAALIRSLGRAGRSRAEIALLGRVGAGAVGRRLPGWAYEHGLDGVEVVADDADEVIAVLPELPAAPPRPTLRAALSPLPATSGMMKTILEGDDR